MYWWTITAPDDAVDDWIADLKEWEGPPHKATVKFEALLQAAYVDTQARTHILTGSLKATGRAESDFDGEVWTGTIEYGGALWRPPMGPGPAKDPVDYAIYEMARGGEHDFFSGLPGFEDKFGEIIDSLFPG